MRLAMEMGQHKVDKAMPVRDLRVEDQVMARYRLQGQARSASPRRRRSEHRQDPAHESRWRPRSACPGRWSRSAMLVVGGAGKMGTWLCRFFDIARARGHGERRRLQHQLPL